MGIQSEILKIAQTYGIKLSGINPYTNLSPQDISNKWDAVSTPRLFGSVCLSISLYLYLFLSLYIYKALDGSDL